MTHLCIHKFTIIGSDNGLAPSRRQVIIWTNASHIAKSTLMKKLQWNINQNSYIFIQENAFENVICNMSAICIGLNVLRT